MGPFPLGTDQGGAPAFCGTAGAFARVEAPLSSGAGMVGPGSRT